MIAALFVARNACYYGLPDVDPWDEARDARLYAGPWPVVAHPPCERWGRWADANGAILGDDGGCFAAALAAVRRWGGVLEHPADSRAWSAFGLIPPIRAGGWTTAGDGGWTCCVDQGWYGHRARKPTWLYAVGCDLPSLRWGSSERVVRVGRYALPDDPVEAKRARRVGIVQRLSRPQRRATPILFRDLLLSIAGSHPGARAATCREEAL